MKTNNKKKVVMITAMFLMIALVIGMGAMTYAKYTTTKGTGAQSATAAKWGIVLTVNTTNLFGSNYEDNQINASGTDIVASVTNAKIAGPGSSGSMTIQISGSAEVLSQVSIVVADGATDIYFDENGGETTDAYYPIKWTLASSTETLASEATLATALEELKEVNTKYEASEDINETYTLSWEWSLDGGNDVYDTAIGALAAATDDDKLSEINAQLGTAYNGSTFSTGVSFEITATIQQIQD